jgi:hypothetical protein
VPVAAGYECQICLTSSFSTLVVPKDSTLDTTFVPGSLQSSKKYYWRVRAYNLGGASAFSALDSFTTLAMIPVAPWPVSPHSTTNEARLTTFVWTSSMYASTYHLQVGTDTVLSQVVRDTTVADTTTTLTTPLDANKLYYWHVGAVNAAGASPYIYPSYFTTGTLLTVHELANEIPKNFTLLQNHPNPFNPSTTLEYSIPTTSRVSLRIYNVLGQIVAQLVDDERSAGWYQVRWDATVTTGIYFYRITAVSVSDPNNRFVQVKKMLLLK